VGAHAQRADLERARLEGAILAGARLVGAPLRRADIPPRSPTAHAATTLGNPTIGASTGTITSMSAYVGAIDAAPYNQYQVASYTDNTGQPHLVGVLA